MAGRSQTSAALTTSGRRSIRSPRGASVADDDVDSFPQEVSFHSSQNVDAVTPRGSLRTGYTTEQRVANVPRALQPSSALSAPPKLAVRPSTAAFRRSREGRRLRRESTRDLCQAPRSIDPRGVSIAGNCPHRVLSSTRAGRCHTTVTLYRSLPMRARRASHCGGPRTPRGRPLDARAASERPPATHLPTAARQALVPTSADARRWRKSRGLRAAIAGALGLVPAKRRCIGAVQRVSAAQGASEGRRARDSRHALLGGPRRGLAA